MLTKKFFAQNSRRGLIATATGALCIVAGLSFISVSIASQGRRPQQPAAVLGGPTTMTLAEALEATSSTLSAARRDHMASEVVGPILPRSKPVRLTIKSIDVHSRVQDLGRTAGGALETPAPGPHYDEAAWYRHSPTPGSLGPAILLGHVDSAADGPSVFFRLGELRPGDHVSVTRADGSVAAFIVDKVHRYAKEKFPTQLVYGNIDHAGLRILTCGGDFDDTTGHYLDNVVVFASLADPLEG